MQREHVEEEGVARLELPGEDLERVPVAFDVGQLLEAPLRKPLRLVVLELGYPLPVAEVLEEAPRVVGRLATAARSLGSARLRSIPRSTSATSSGENAPRTQTTPSRWKSSWSAGHEPIACGNRNSSSGSYRFFTLTSRA